MTIVIPHEEVLVFGILPLPLLYILVGCALTIYWSENSDNINVLMNGTIVLWLFLWPVFLVLFVMNTIKEMAVK